MTTIELIAYFAGCYVVGFGALIVIQCLFVVALCGAIAGGSR